MPVVHVLGKPEEDNAMDTSTAQPTQGVAEKSDDAATRGSLEAATPGPFVRSVANRPCLVLFVSIVLGVVLSGVGLVVGGFEIATENKGWQTRGTFISERAVQVEAIWFNRWPGREDQWYADDDDRRRRLLASEEPPRGTSEGPGSRAHSWSGLLADLKHAGPTYEHSTLPGTAQRRGQLGPLQASRARGQLAPLQASRRPAGPRGLGSGGAEEERERRRLAEGEGEAMCMAQWEWSDLDIIVEAPEGRSVFEPELLQDVCDLEQQALHLPGVSDHRRTWGCCVNVQQRLADTDSDAAWCLEEPFARPPASIVQMLRILTPGGGAMSCEDLFAAPGYLEQLLTVVASCALKFRTLGQDLMEQDDQCALLPSIGSLVGSDFEVDPLLPHSLHSRYTRTVLPLDDGAGEVLMDHYDTLDGGLSTQHVSYCFSQEVLEDEVSDEALLTDMQLLNGAIAVIFVLMMIITGSLFLTLLGMVQILLAFPTAFFAYKLVLGLKYFPFLNFLGLFVIMGIGADDVFVFYNKWVRAAGALPPGAPAEAVAALCYREAASAMCITSITTAGAFFATAIAQVAPIRLFAIFMGLMVIFDYIYDITIFAAAVAYQHRVLLPYTGPGAAPLPRSWGWLFSFSACACCCGGRRPPQPPAPAPGKQNVLDVEMHSADGAPQGFIPNPLGSGTAAAMGDATVAGRVSRFMAGPYFSALHSARWPVVVAFVALFVVSSIFAARLESPTDSEVQLWPDGHNFNTYSKHSRLKFLSSGADDLFQARMVWGLRPGDNGNLWEPESPSSLILDPAFDPSTPEALEHIRYACNATLSNAALVATAYNFECPLDDFAEWVQAVARGLAAADARAEAEAEGGGGAPEGGGSVDSGACEALMAPEDGSDDPWTSPIAKALGGPCAEGVGARCCAGLEAMFAGAGAGPGCLCEPSLYGLLEAQLGGPADPAAMEQALWQCEGEHGTTFLWRGREGCPGEFGGGGGDDVGRQWREAFVEACGEEAAARGVVAPGKLSSCLRQWKHGHGDGHGHVWFHPDTGELAIVMNSFFLPLQWESSNAEQHDVFDLWEAHMKDMNAVAPPGVDAMFFSSFSFWWMDTWDSMRETAYMSALITLSISAGVVLLATSNTIITLGAILSITGILMSITATLVGMSWTLGLLEAICASITIGMSVDFILHMSHAYSVAGDVPECGSRQQRAHQMLSSMGLTIFLAALTTFTASLLLLFCTIRFFNQFGVILIFTILYSLLVSCLFFPALMCAIGPEGRAGHLPLHKLLALCGRK